MSQRGTRYICRRYVVTPKEKKPHQKFRCRCIHQMHIKTDSQGTGYGDMDAIRLAEEVFEWLAVLGMVMNM